MNKTHTFFILALLVILAALGDATTTAYCISLGFNETRAYGTIPFLPALIFGATLFAIYLVPLQPRFELIRTGIAATLVLFSFSGFIWNTIGLHFLI